MTKKQFEEKSNLFTTSKLRKHLKVHHPEKLQQLEESEKAAAKTASKGTSQNQSSSTVITLKDCLERSCP